MSGRRRQGRDPVSRQPDVPTEPQPEVRSESPPADVAAEARPAAPPRPPAPTGAARSSRRQARLERRARRRRFGVVGIGLTLVVLAAIVVAAVLVGRKVTSHHSAVKRVQTTLLLQLQAPDRTAATSALLAHDTGAKQGLELLVPSRMITTVCGFGSEPFGAVLGQSDGVTASRQTLSSVLADATIDGSWVLSSAQLATLVDRVGGVTVDVDTNVVQHTAKGDLLVIPRGTGRQLNGTQAAQFATYVASRQEDASAQLARFQSVFEALLAKLPTAPAAVVGDLRQLGPNGASTLGADRLAALLTGLAVDARSNNLLPTDLPVTTIDSGGAPAYSADVTKVRDLVGRNLAASWPASVRAPRPTVQLLNGIGTPGLVRSACPRLAAAGLAFAGSDNVSPFSNDPSQVQVPSLAQQPLGERVARALRLPLSDVHPASLGQSVANVVVVLGRDYKP